MSDMHDKPKPSKKKPAAIPEDAQNANWLKRGIFKWPPEDRPRPPKRAAKDEQPDV